MITVTVDVVEFFGQFGYSVRIYSDQENISIKFDQGGFFLKDVAIFSAVNRTENLLRKIFSSSEKVQYTINHETFNDFYL